MSQTRSRIPLGLAPDKGSPGLLSQSGYCLRNERNSRGPDSDGVGMSEAQEKGRTRVQSPDPAGMNRDAVPERQTGKVILWRKNEIQVQHKRVIRELDHVRG